MKVDIKGDWTGLAQYEDSSIPCIGLDYFSTPDGWTIGYDIVFRLAFPMPKDILDTPGLRARFESAFKSVFGLSDDHFLTTPLDAGGVFWRIYWDKQGFDLHIIDKCLESMNICAEENNARVIDIGVTFIPRSMSQIEELVKKNNLKPLEHE